MGRNETELAQIRASGPFAAPELPALRNSLAALALTLKEIANSDGWEGRAATAASTQFEELSRTYLELEGVIGDIQTEIDRANRVRAAALDDYDALPSAQAPAWVHDTLEAFDFPGIPDPVDIAQGGLSVIENFLGGQREAAAGRILEAYRTALEDRALQTESLRGELARVTGRFPSGGGGEPLPDDDASTGTWNGGGAYRGAGSTGVEFRAPGARPPYGTPDDDDVWVGVDDPNTGVLPGSPGGGGSGGPGGPGSGGGGVPGVIGAGAGAAATGAGALAATRFAGGAVGGLAHGGGAAVGSAVRGGGGLLGAAGTGAPGATASRAGVAGRGGSGLLGSGGVTGAQGRDDRKRSPGRGLGGPIAPKLDDEDESALPGSGARAGGRDESSDSALDG